MSIRLAKELADIGTDLETLGRVAAKGDQPTAQTGKDGTVRRAAAVATISTANATDLATALTLVNQCKTTINALLTSLRAAGTLAP